MRQDLTQGGTSGIILNGGIYRAIKFPWSIESACMCRHKHEKGAWPRKLCGNVPLKIYARERVTCIRPILTPVTGVKILVKRSKPKSRPGQVVKVEVAQSKKVQSSGPTPPFNNLCACASAAA
jgi:hypothetical protein